MKAIPSPPSQLSMARHRFMPTGRSSSPPITVAPVVVMPDTASKYASAKASPGAPIQNGSAPNNGTIVQIPVVSR